ncbi:hypothetical protein [Pseudoclavibacter helvolus]|uniref:hypothetical protein n=1 Tax=Pseudoclavibacter helvolus TaxID=255205 RepID=UPI00083844E7|nr:hypothetical protein [Pseudoclavibacter helvolus]
MATPSSIGLQAAGLLATLGDPDADPNRSHAVIVTDPVANPGFLEAYGPYENAAEAAAALEVIRAKIDMGRPGGWAWTYTVTPLRSTP